MNAGIHYQLYVLGTKLYIPSTINIQKKGAQQSHLGRQKMGWFLTDQPVHQVKLKY